MSNTQVYVLYGRVEEDAEWHNMMSFDTATQANQYRRFYNLTDPRFYKVEKETVNGQ